MKKSKTLAMLLSASMLTGVLAGCAASAPAPAAAPAEAAPAAETAEASAEAPASGDTVKLEFFDVAANYQGDQVGWFAKVLKDELNLEINIIAPQVAGDAVYQTRARERLRGQRPREGHQR